MSWYLSSFCVYTRCIGLRGEHFGQRSSPCSDLPDDVANHRGSFLVRQHLHVTRIRRDALLNPLGFVCLNNQTRYGPHWKGSQTGGCSINWFFEACSSGLTLVNSKHDFTLALKHPDLSSQRVSHFRLMLRRGRHAVPSEE